jgi:hypothetical protein
MAKADAGDSVGTDRGDLKRLLRFSMKEPVHAAFALGGDGKPIIVLDKRKQPRALEKGIKDGAPGSKNHRFGIVMVDPDEPKIARFVINQPASGMAKKLVIALKGTGFNKVRIVLDDGTDVEAAEGEKDDGDDAPDADADGGDGDTGTAKDGQPEEPAPSEATTSAPDGADSSQARDDTNADSDSAATSASSSDSAPANGQPDAATLTNTLTALVKRMMSVIANDPSQKAGLAELATDAQASLKRGDLAQAAAGIDVLRQAIESASGQPSGDQETPDSPVTAGTDTDDADDTGDGTSPSANDTAPPATETAPPLTGRGQDAAGLMASLTALVKQLMPIVAADPSQRDAFKGIVAQAQASLKSGDLETASGHVDSLQAMLVGGGTRAATASPQASAGQSGPQPPTNGADPAMLERLKKTSQVWDATIAKMTRDLDQLAKTVTVASKDHELGESFEKEFQTVVEPLVQTVDGQLSDLLHGAAEAGSAEEQQRLLTEVRKAVGQLQKFVQSHPAIDHVDGNPFHPVTIGKTLNASLAAVSNAVS